MNKGTVFVVHCIDTEGPLYEDFKVPFEQIKNIFGIEIEPTEQNLEKLKRGEIDLSGKEEAIKNLIDERKRATKGNWQDIQNMLDEITTIEFRKKLVDSKGNGWIYNWFCMDHVGFFGENPRRRDKGHHKIFDRYMNMVNKQNMGDIVQFHYHPVSISGNYNDSGTAYWGSDNLNQILCHKIIDRKWFPSAFRPGFHTERPDSHWFLEQWIPFDYGNQAFRGEDTEQLDCSAGRFGDWRYAPKEWIPYHPSYEDYQKKGTCKRWIARCLNMYARIRQITEQDVIEAFEEAANGKNVILAFTNHDYKDMIFEIDRVRNLIEKVSREYKDVMFLYENALEAMRKCMNLETSYVGLNAEIICVDGIDRLLIRANDVFGVQPFLAIKTKNERYIWDNFDFVDTNLWSYTFDNNTIRLDEVDIIGVAANSSSAEMQVVLLDNEGNEK